MELINILSAPWAIRPESLTEIVTILKTHLNGDNIDLAAIEARLGKPRENNQERYTVTPDGIAVIPIEGVISKRMDLFTQIFGGCSTELIGQGFHEALTRPDVKAILFLIDSPGGTVDGSQQLAEQIYKARGVKPIATLVDGLMCSAALWIGSAADRVYINGSLVQTGSIGVVCSHTDVSRAEEMQGLKVTEITSGRYKRIASQHSPLSDEGRATIQDMLDYVYGKFVDDIATFRGVSPEIVQMTMADGRVFIGKQAIEAGLVDGIKTKAQVLKELSTGKLSAKRTAAPTYTAAAPSPTIAAPALPHIHAKVIHSQPAPVPVPKVLTGLDLWKEKWKADPVLQKEFLGSFETYRAYMENFKERV